MDFSMFNKKKRSKMKMENSALKRKTREVDVFIPKLMPGIANGAQPKELKTNIIPRMQRLIRQYQTLPDAESKNSILKELLIKATYEKTVKNNKGTVDRNNFTIEIFPNLLSSKK